MKRFLLATLLMLPAMRLTGEEATPLVGFESCKDAEIARFELDLARARSSGYEGQIDHVNASQIDICGVHGIILCDRGEASVTCQKKLAHEQEDLRQAILATLPAPQQLAQTQGQLFEALYPKVWELAHGSSAGPDCAGNTPVLEAWCEAREATRRVEMAVLAYQLARDGDAMETAFNLGWARKPAPRRPKARDESVIKEKVQE